MEGTESDMHARVGMAKARTLLEVKVGIVAELRTRCEAVRSTDCRAGVRGMVGSRTSKFEDSFVTIGVSRNLLLIFIEGS